MNELEILMKAEMEKAEVNKKTVEQLRKEQRTKAIDFCNKMVEKLSFLSEYGCKVYTDRIPSRFFIDYKEHGRYTKTACISLKSTTKVYDGERYSEIHAEEKFFVDWDYRVCHNGNKDDNLTTEGVIRGLVKRMK